MELVVVYCNKDTKDIILLVPIQKDEILTHGDCVTGNGMLSALYIMQITSNDSKTISRRQWFGMTFNNAYWLQVK
jgi:hypothetical protein